MSAHEDQGDGCSCLGLRFTVYTGSRAQKHDMRRAQLLMEAITNLYEFLCIRKLGKIEKKECKVPIQQKLEKSYCERHFG